MDISALKPLINWLQAHTAWGIAFVFWISFAESIAVFGLVVPGAIIMATVGLLMGSGILPWHITLAAAVLGGFLGDILSFWFGKRYHNQIRSMWPFRKVPKLINKCEHFFKLHGGKSVLIGRFLGAIRPLIPVIAGMLKMSTTRFVIADFIAAFLWAPLYMLPGILMGAVSLTLPPKFASQLLLYLVFGLVVLCLIFWLLKRITFYLSQQLNQLFKKCWTQIQTNAKFSFYTDFIKCKTNCNDHIQLLLSAIFLGCLSIFLVITCSVIFSYGFVDLNQSVYHILKSLYTPTLQPFFIALTILGNKKPLIIFWLALLAWFVLRGKQNIALHWLILGCFSIGLTGLFKRIIISPRPTGLTYSLSGFSYPSGHTVLSLTLLGFFVYIINQSLPRYFRVINYYLLGIIISLIAFSRLYLNAHWVTDVLGGIFLGLSLLLITIISYRRDKKIKSLGLSRFYTAIFGLIVLIASWNFYLYQDFAKAKIDYLPRWRINMILADDWWQKGLPNTPLIRKNRLNQPEQILNIEWIGNIQEIKQKLLKANWQEQPKTELKTTINYLRHKDTRNLLPLFNPVYMDRYPVLVMAKFIVDENKLLILRLWHSDTYIYETEEPIWVGALSFYKPSENVFTHFIPDVIHFEWKKLFYPQIKRLNRQDDAGWQQQVLLIRSKDN